MNNEYKVGNQEINFLNNIYIKLDYIIVVINNVFYFIYYYYYNHYDNHHLDTNKQILI
jgi:hypothetical protein